MTRPTIPQEPANLSQAEKEALAERYLPMLRQAANKYGLTWSDREELESLLLVVLAELLNDARIIKNKEPDAWVASRFRYACLSFYYYGPEETISLETPIGEGEGLCLGDVIATSSSLPRLQAQVQVPVTLQMALAQLSANERAVVLRRFGLEYGDECYGVHEPIEIEAECGMSNSGVYRAAKRAYAKLARLLAGTGEREVVA